MYSIYICYLQEHFKIRQSEQFLLRPIYTEHPRQCCDNSAVMLAILFTLKTMESWSIQTELERDRDWELNQDK